MNTPAFIKQNVCLAPMTTIGVGGEARYYAEVMDEGELAAALRWSQEAQVPTLMLGEGSNLLVADAGFEGLVIKQACKGVQFEKRGTRTLVRAAAGESWDALVERCTAESLAGIECLSGIPGLVGAAPIQNIGAYGQELSSAVHRVRCLDRFTGEVTQFAQSDCDFDYRMSRFKADSQQRYVVSEVVLDLQPGGTATVRYGELSKRLTSDASLTDVRKAVLSIRREKSMVVDPDDPNSRSAGSFFMNPRVSAEVMGQVRMGLQRLGVAEEDMPAWRLEDGRTKLAAAWLIERSGMERGYGTGPVGLSEKHTLALVNRGGACASDVVAFAAEVRRRVHACFGVMLSPEPVFVGFDTPVDELLA